jgi:signal transduction histidine kinase
MRGSKMQQLSDTKTNNASKDDAFLGQSQMSSLIRSIDWSKSTIGPMQQWPQSLKTSLSILLTSQHPMFIWWGTDLIQFYNDAYRPILGETKHPKAMGQHGQEGWAEIWDIVEPLISSVFKGKATWNVDTMLPLKRYGYVEECYFNFGYSPIHDESKGIAGVFVACSETTKQVLNTRRLNTLHELSSQISDAKTISQACTNFIKIIANNTADIPYALCYLFNPEHSKAYLEGICGLTKNMAASPEMISINSDKPDEQQPSWPIDKLLTTQQPIILNSLPDNFAPLPGGPWSENSHTAVLIPISQAISSEHIGVLIVGISPRLSLSDDYRSFLTQVTSHLSSAIVNAKFCEEEKKRLEQLAEIDKAKIVFFSNISHEFRTPLTLMLGPLEESLNDTHYPLPGMQRERQLMIQRNASRLLKLVNSLLDFSRLEANRIQAWYEATDLAQFSTELINMLESAFKRANITLIVAIEPLDEFIYVDKEMWEKIFSNLIFNALKYTLAGSVKVTLKKGKMGAELTVEDTGVGISQDDIPRVFERFYRVENAQGRSHEGTGIGLALTQSLVKLHGGTITLESKLGEGSIFQVTIPFGNAHLPQERLREAHSTSFIPVNSSLSFIEEPINYIASSKQEDRLSDENSTNLSLPNSVRILIIDDNADMRQHFQRLLAPLWDVILADNGEVALTLLQTQTVNVIVSDVMMPKMDGFQLIKQLQKDNRLKNIPVILVSARAGKEARFEALQAGAAEYLIKPFVPKELIIQVQKQLSLQNTLDKIQLQKKLQEEFIDTVCHEVRNPLNGMFGSVDELSFLVQQMDSFLKEQEKLLSWEASNTISKQIQVLKEILNNLTVCVDQQRVIVDDVLDLSKLENNKVVLHLQPFSPKQAILAALQMFQQQLNQKKLTLHLDLADEFYINSDGGRFTQIIINLISNAIKFTSQGSITLSLTQQKIDSKNLQITVHIKDTGLGMTPSECQKLFQPFTQANSAVSSHYGGTGLGLAICKKLITMMGGNIAVNSKKDQGSDFYFTVVAPPAKQPIVALTEKNNTALSSNVINQASSRYILIAEDNPINQRILVKYIKDTGHTCAIASNGLEAVNLYRKNLFDMVFMDIEMPIMDGLEATRQLRLYEKQKQYAPVFIVGLSGNARAEQIETALQAGMNAYITKPYHKEILLNHIQKATMHSRSLQSEKKSVKDNNLRLSPNQTSAHFFSQHSPNSMTNYWQNFQHRAHALLVDHYPFAFYVQNEQLTIELLPQLPERSALVCKLVLKELQEILQTVFSLEHDQTTLTDIKLKLKLPSSSQQELVQTILIKAGFEKNNALELYKIKT